MRRPLERAHVPAYFAHGTSRPDASGRAFLVLLACAAEGLSARRFAEYLSLGQVPALAENGTPLIGQQQIWVSASDEVIPESVVPELEEEMAPASPPERVEETDSMVGGSLRTPWKWEELLVEAAVVGGKGRWERRLAGLASELDIRVAELCKEDPESPRIAAIERQLAQLGHLRRFALPIIAMLAELPQRATWGEWLGALERLAPMVLRSCERVLRVLAELRPMAEVGPVTLEEVCEAFSQRLTDLSTEPPRNRFGRVFVGSPEQFRGRSFAVIFVPGLAERIFPQKLHEDPLLLDEDRTQIVTADPPLLTRADRTAEERLRLRIAASATESRIYFSYPRVEVALARPRVPSFYALDVRRTTLGALPNVDGFEREAARNGGAELAWFAPRSPSVAIDDIEHDLAVLRPLLIADPKSVRGQGRYLMELSPPLGRSLRMRWKRWQKTWSGFDGLCDGSDSTQAELSRFRLISRAYSPTSLQHFAACPYRFLLSAIYRLAAREESVPLQMLDPMTRGGMYHAVLARFLRFARNNKFLPLTAATIAAAQKQMDGILGDVAAQYHDALAPALERVWQDEIESLHADLRGWLTHLVEHPDGYLPLLIEYGFGLPSDNNRDQQSTAASAQLDGGFLVHGIVDLIEKREQAADVRITDHKTGKNRTEEGMVVGKGEFLQPVLYSLSVEALQAGTVSEARLSFCTAAGGYAERRVEMNEAARRAGLNVLRTIDHAIETAFLPPAPKEDGCKWCDFRSVCGPYEELRSGRKDPGPLAALLKLREMQ